MTESKTGYKRKPKSERLPPVWRIETENKLQEYLIDTYLYFRAYDPGYTKGTAAYRKIYKRSASIHVKPGQAVTLIFQDHVIRYNWAAQKHFLCDETTMVRTVYRTKKDRPAFYFYDVLYNEGGRKRKSNVSPVTGELNYRLLGQEMDTATVFRTWRAIAEDVFGQPIGMETIYPGIEHFGRKGFHLLGFDTMRCTTAMDATQQIFGKKCYRKDLVRAVGNKMQNISQQNRADILAWTGLFKRLVPIDWLVLSVNLPHHDLEIGDELVVEFLSPAGRTVFRNMIAHLKPNERKNVLMNTHGTHHGYLLRDTVNAYARLTQVNMTPFPAVRENMKNLHALHDLLIAENTRVTRERQREWTRTQYNPEQMFINTNEHVERFAFMLELDPRLDIRIARDYETLSGWSDYMVNCISSYFSQRCLLGGVFEDGVLIANFELQATGNPYDITDRETWRYSLNQLLGKRNQKLDTAEKNHIENILDGYGVQLKSGRWA